MGVVSVSSLVIGVEENWMEYGALALSGRLMIVRSWRNINPVLMT